MKNTYRIEYWHFHSCQHIKKFTNKKKAQKWLKNSGWWIDYDMGDCMIYIYKNKEKVDWISKDKDWKNKTY